jgi:hypothetical protein
MALGYNVSPYYLKVRYSGSSTPRIIVFSSGSPEPIACGETKWVNPALKKITFYNKCRALKCN